MISILFIIGLILFFVIWEILYLIQCKYKDFMFGSIWLWTDDIPTWQDSKWIALMNLFIICCGIAALVGIFVLLNQVHILLESVIVLVCGIIFFGLNYMFQGGKKNGKRKY